MSLKLVGVREKSEWKESRVCFQLKKGEGWRHEIWRYIFGKGNESNFV